MKLQRISDLDWINYIEGPHTKVDLLLIVLEVLIFLNVGI